MQLTISIPTHNLANYLDEALSSIISEPGLGVDYEIVLSDNSVTSETQNLYKKKYINYSGIYYYRSLNYDSLDANVNRAVELGKGKYVWIFGDDDLILPGAIITIIKYLKNYQPSILVVNSQSFGKKGIIEKRRVPINNNLVYEKKEDDIFLADFGSYLTYIGGIVVDKELWIKNFDHSKIGSYFAHLDVLFKIKKNRVAHFLSKNCIKMRLGSQTWTGKSFEIWNIFFAEIIWDLKGYGCEYKKKVISRYPFRSPKILLASRAYGRLNFKVWVEFVQKSKEISKVFKLLILIICLIPRNILKFLYKFLILNIRKKHTLTFSPKLALAILDL